MTTPSRRVLLLACTTAYVKHLLVSAEVAVDDLYAQAATGGAVPDAAFSGDLGGESGPSETRSETSTLSLLQNPPPATSSVDLLSSSVGPAPTAATSLTQQLQDFLYSGGSSSSSSTASAAGGGALKTSSSAGSLESFYDNNYGDEAKALKLEAEKRKRDLELRRKKQTMQLVTDSTIPTATAKGAVLVQHKAEGKTGKAVQAQQERKGFLFRAESPSLGANKGTSLHELSRVVEEYDVPLDELQNENMKNDSTEDDGTSSKTSTTSSQKLEKEALTRDEELRGKSDGKLVSGGKYSAKDVEYIQHLRQQKGLVLKEPTHEKLELSSRNSMTKNRNIIALLATSSGRSPDELARQQQECETFGKFLKGNAVKGSKLIAQWHNSCKTGDPARCQAVVGAVTPFADDLNWNLMILIFLHEHLRFPFFITAVGIYIFRATMGHCCYCKLCL
ncbi:unnamed protein product [Amoebophrya sp. A120]|nr:unnamed protein product [Amoebophrya sp. A120]|eukprot:GSA120T00008570001.1